MNRRIVWILARAKQHFDDATIRDKLNWMRQKFPELARRIDDRSILYVNERGAVPQWRIPAAHGIVSQGSSKSAPWQSHKSGPSSAGNDKGDNSSSDVVGSEVKQDKGKASHIRTVPAVEKTLENFKPLQGLTVRFTDQGLPWLGPKADDTEPLPPIYQNPTPLVFVRNLPETSLVQENHSLPFSRQPMSGALAT